MIPTSPILTSAVALCPKARYSVLGFPLNSLWKSPFSRSSFILVTKFILLYGHETCPLMLSSSSQAVSIFSYFKVLKLPWTIWRRRWDSNPCGPITTPNGLANRPLQPLEYFSVNGSAHGIRTRECHRERVMS